MERKRRHAVTATWFIVFMLVLSGCSHMSVSDKRSMAANAPTGEIRIAVVWPFRSNNDLFREGVNLAVEEVNGSGGINGKQLRIIERDDESSVTKGLEIAQQLADDPAIAAVIGHRNSFVSLPASSVYNRAGLLMLSPASSVPELTAERLPLTFRSISSDAELAKRLAGYVRRQAHRRMVVVYDDNAYGKGLANAFSRYAKSEGITIVDRLADYEDMSRLRELKYKWEQLAYDGIFIAKSNTSGAQVMADIRNIGIGVPLYGGNAMDSAVVGQEAGSSAEGLIVGSYFDPGSGRKQVQSFVQQFERKFGVRPSQYSALGYDAVRLLAVAMAEAGAASSDRVAAAMRKLQWEGVIGTHRFSEEGDDIGDLMVIKRWKNGAFVPIE